MDDVRQGRICRALRRRFGLTQRALGRRVGLSQQTISLVERGHGGRLASATLRRIFGALDARWEPTIGWRGGDLDRLLDGAHARLVGATVELLRRRGWRIEIEATYATYGERGSIDILAWWPPGRIALVVEAKSELVSVEATLRKVDEKVRLTHRELSLARFGEPPTAVARLLVLPATSTERRRVASAGRVLHVALPDRGATVRKWLIRPRDPIRGILFVADTHARGAGTRHAGSPG